MIGRTALAYAVIGCTLVLVAGCGGSSDTSGPSDTSTSVGAGSATLTTPPSTSSAPVAAPIWPAPSDPLARAVAAGLKPDVKEHLAYHVHAHLDVFVNGQPIVVPAGIGINVKDPGVKTFTDTPDGSLGYGGITGCRTPCISPLHTHDTTGILHTESPVSKPNTLGEFFVEWAVRLTDSCVDKYCAPTPIAFYLNGKPYTQDPRSITLTDELEIALVIGTPPAKIPDTADFSQA